MNKNTLKQTKFEDKTVKSTQISPVLVGLHDFQIFPGRTYGACVKRSLPSQSFSSESAAKYLHDLLVGGRKIQISPLLGEQDQSNALPKGQQSVSTSKMNYAFTSLNGFLFNCPSLIFYNALRFWFCNFIIHESA